LTIFGKNGSSFGFYSLDALVYAIAETSPVSTLHLLDINGFTYDGGGDYYHEQEAQVHSP
jgi:hypothetical protein